MIAVLLAVVLSFTCINNTATVYAVTYQISSYDLSSEDMYDFFGDVVDQYSLLQYGGESRVVNNLLFVYRDGLLTQIIDAWGNEVSVNLDSFDVTADSSTVELISDYLTVDLEFEEHGLVSLDIQESEINVQFERNEIGDITRVITNDMDVEIARESTETLVTINDTYNIPFSLPDEVDLIQGPVQRFIESDTIVADLLFDIEDRVTRIDFSNNVTLFASYDEFGFSSTSVFEAEEDVLLPLIETLITPITTQVGELIRLDEIHFQSNDNLIRYVMNNFGLIDSIYQNIGMALEYTYDNVTGDLIAVNDLVNNRRSMYEFDQRGNVQTRTVLTSNGAEVTRFGYANPFWSDQLTHVGNSQIMYDEVGNVTHMLGKGLEWEDGLLASVINNDIVTSFEYNQFGQRITKKVGSDVTSFRVDDLGRTIAEFSSNGQVIEYMFDNEDNLLGFINDGEQFFYQKNLFGDITGIWDCNLNLVVEYSYDAWGNALSISGTKADTIGSINPYRYRGYRFDDSIGLHFIHGRYYSPVLMRFISPDQNVFSERVSISHNLYSFAETFSDQVCCWVDIAQPYMENHAAYGYICRLTRAEPARGGKGKLLQKFIQSFPFAAT